MEHGGRKLYILGDAKQRAWAEKAISDIWAGPQRLVSGKTKFVDLEVVLHYQTDRAVLMSLDGQKRNTNGRLGAMLALQQGASALEWPPSKHRWGGPPTAA